VRLVRLVRLVLDAVELGGHRGDLLGGALAQLAVDRVVDAVDVVGVGPGDPAGLEELGEGRQGLEIAGAKRVDQLATVLAQGLEVARAALLAGLGRRDRRRGGRGRGVLGGRGALGLLGALGALLRGGRPHRTGNRLESVGHQPGFHEGPEPLAAEIEPALALDAVAHQHVLEATEGPLAVDAGRELGAQLGLLDHRDVALHPAVLFAAADGGDPQVVRVDVDASMHLRVSHPVDHA
jgi:hypothetical protein